MPSKKQYNLVQNDENDTRIPLHSEEAFHRGIVFHAKFIGSMEVQRPTSRMEIVAAMRRIRYDFKAKGIKKKKVTLEVSVDGLKVTLRKKKFPILQKKQHWLDESKLALMHHPIYRIFYVSHDSHDLKIFSYIARDGNNNSFRCNVFKSSKKSQAMRVVRTVGQAFEVCHKLSLNNPAGGNGTANNNEDSCNNGSTTTDKDNELLNENNQHHHHHHHHHHRHRRDSRDDEHYDDNNDDEFASLQHHPQQHSPSSVHKDISLLGDSVDESILDQPCPQIRSHHGDVVVTSTPADPTNCPSIGQTPLISEQLMNGAELTALKHEIQLLRERLEQQSQQTRAAVAHARLLQDQLAAETAARVEAQARTHQLLVQNKELLEHIAALVSHLREHERSGGVPLTSSQMTSLAGISQGAMELGQYNQASWEPAAQAPPAVIPAPYPHAYYHPLGAYGYPRPISSLGYADELRYQAQLWDNVRLAVNNLYPPPQPYVHVPASAPASPHLVRPGYGLPPTGRSRVTQQMPQQQPATPSSSTTLPRSSRLQPRTVAFQQQRSRSLDRPQDSASKEASFIKPLPSQVRSNGTSSGIPKPVPNSNLRPRQVPPVCTPSLKEEAVQTEAPACEPPVITVAKIDGDEDKAGDKEEEEEEEEESGESEKDDELPELPRPAVRRRNSQ